MVQGGSTSEARTRNPYLPTHQRLIHSMKPFRPYNPVCSKQHQSLQFALGRVRQATIPLDLTDRLNARASLEPSADVPQTISYT